MPLYRLKVVYIGTSFSGYQSQPDDNAVQDHLERAFKTFFRHPQRIKGASRTDRGVHAEGQIITLRTSTPFQERRWKRSLNAILPPEIKVREITPLEMDFHPIRDAVGKVYRYRIWQGNCDHPMVMPFVWSHFPKLDTEILKSVVKDFVGAHDFSSFCNQGTVVKNYEREIFAIEVEVNGPLINIWIMGDGFLKQMVRIMVGTLVDISLGRLPKEAIPGILAAKSRLKASETAPACGLSLVEIFYDTLPSLQEVMEKSRNGYGLAL